MPDFGFDDWMDAQLRNVPVPRDLHARLAANRPEPRPSDEEIDAALRNVPLPPHLARHLRRIPWQHPLSSPWRIGALAASVLLVVGAVSYFTVGGNVDNGVVDSGFDTPQAAVAVQPPAKKSANPTRLVMRPKSQPAKAKSPTRRQQPLEVVLGDSHESTAERQNQLPQTLRQVAGVGASIREAVEAKRRAQSALGASGTMERLPQLDVFEPPLARGITPPRNRGYDMLFQLRYGEHPFVSPLAHKDLQVSRVPFTFHTASYDQAVAEVDQGRLPRTEDIRVEDFLAAQRYALPAPAGGLALHAAASPSPLGEPGLHLLQLVVQGAEAPQPKRPPTRLIAVVDTSSAMQLGARSKTVTRALAKLSEHLSSGDRLTLIGFAEEPRLLAADVTGPDLAKFLATDTLDHTAGSADLAAAIQAACDAAQALPRAEPRRVVLITGRSDMDDDTLAVAQDSLSKLAAAGVPWQIVRVASSSPDARLNELAKRAKGRVVDIASADELHGAFFESLAGRSDLVARGVSMRITFNPKVVNSYRMLGHEAATLTGESGDPLEVDFHAEQAGTALYELWLKPSKDGTRDGDVAVVELFWSDPSGHPRRSVLPIRRNAVAPSFSQAPAWLKQGVVAAKTAEFLRASYYVPNSRRLGQLLDLAAEVEAGAADQPEFRALRGLIERADKLR